MERETSLPEEHPVLPIAPLYPKTDRITKTKNMKKTKNIVIACLLALTALGRAADPETTTAPVVTIQNGWLWYGLTAGGNIVSVYCHPSRAEYIRCHFRKATGQDGAQIGEMIAQTELMAAAKSYETPKKQMEALPKDAQTEQGAQSSLTRIAAWAGGQTNETSIGGGIENAPTDLRIFAEKLRRICEEAPQTKVSGAIFSVDVDRILGPENQTYAQLIVKSGRKFVDWDLESLTPAIRGVCTHPETVEVLTPEEMTWARGKFPVGEPSIFVRVGGHSVQLILIGPPEAKKGG